MWLQWELDPQKLWKQCLGEVLSPAACKKSVREVLLPDFLQEKIINVNFSRLVTMLERVVLV